MKNLSIKDGLKRRISALVLALMIGVTPSIAKADTSSDSEKEVIIEDSTKVPKSAIKLFFNLCGLIEKADETGELPQEYDMKYMVPELLLGQYISELTGEINDTVDKIVDNPKEQELTLEFPRNYIDLNKEFAQKMELIICKLEAYAKNKDPNTLGEIFYELSTMYAEGLELDEINVTNAVFDLNAVLLMHVALLNGEAPIYAGKYNEAANEILKLRSGVDYKNKVMLQLLIDTIDAKKGSLSSDADQKCK